MTQILYPLILLLFANYLFAQSNVMENLLWQNRIVLIYSEGDVFSKKQIKTIGDLDNEFSERKLMLIEVQNNRIRLLNQSTDKWIGDSNVFKKYFQKNKKPAVLLVGLDGGVKLRRNEIVSRKEIFDLIDSMPMRRFEMQTKNKKPESTGDPGL